ncbi:MAG: hypothetical protein QW318_06270 [Candidatus Caldarchaeum sp.]
MSKGAKQTATRPWFPKPLGNLLKDMALEAFSPTSREALFGRVFLDPQAYMQVGSLLSDIATGRQLNVLGSPEVQNYLQALQAYSNQNLAKNLNQIKSEAALSGHLGLGGSSSLQKMATQAAIESQRNLDAIVAPELLNLYGAERGRQLSAIAPYQQHLMLPYQLGTDLAGMLSGSVSTMKPQPLLSFLSK